MEWMSSLKFRLPAAILLLLALFVGSILTTLNLMKLRRHDYAILNLSGQLRVLSHDMAALAREYRGSLPDQSRTAGADPLFEKQLQPMLDRYDAIIQGFRERRLKPELTGRDEPLTCTWDEASRNELDVTAAVWDRFRDGLNSVRQANRHDTAALAEYVQKGAGDLMRASDNLTRAFVAMMEGKLRRIRLWNLGAIGAAVLLATVLLVLMITRIIRPMRTAVTAFERIADGDLTYQLPVRGADEIGRTAAAFNRLLSRIQSLFRLGRDMNRGITLPETLAVIRREIQPFFPVDWIGLFSFDETGCMDLAVTDGPPVRMDDSAIPDQAACVPAELQAADRTSPLIVDDLADRSVEAPLFRKLNAAGFRSLAALPIREPGASEALLVFASHSPGAYQERESRFLETLGGHVSRVLVRTVATDNLIVAAVEGLARLAENRDPETGDHLMRMSLYCERIADAYLQAHPDTPVPAAFPRLVKRFAPMHDIGKVGVPDAVLLKPGRLTEAEWEEMKQHPVIGGAVLRRCEAQVARLGRRVFEVAIEIAECHHEKVDGTGYPAGLRGSDIPLSARIVTAADVFDALTSRRPYKDPWPFDAAVAELKKDAGTHFDPDVIAAFLSELPAIRAIYDRHKHV